MSGRLLVARELRRTIFVAVGHRFAMALLPHALELLTGREVQPVRQPELVGARDRVFHGGTATIAGTIRAALAPARTAMYAGWTDAEREIVLGEVHRLSRLVSERAADAHREEFGTDWSGAADVAHPYRYDLDPRRPYRTRTLTFLAHHLNPDLDASLSGSELGQAEHLAVGLADLYSAFDAAECPAPERLPSTLEHLFLLSGLATLRDETAERIVFDADHTPLYRVRAAPPDRWTVTALRPPLNGLLHERPGRCPAVNVLPPETDRDRALLAEFRALVTTLTRDHCPPTLSPLGVSAADVSAALAAAIADQLVNRHGIAVIPGEVTR